MPTTTTKRTKKQAQENLKKIRQEESDRIRNKPIENPHRDRILQYFSQWNNVAEAANNLDIPMNIVSGALRELDKEGLIIPRDGGMEWKANREPWLCDDWFSSEKRIIEESFSFKVDVGRKLIKFEIGEEGKFAKDKVYKFEVSKRSLISQIKRYNILPSEYAIAYINTHLTNKLGMAIPNGDRYYFLDEKFKLLPFDRKEIEKIIKIDNISPQEFFLYKQNEKELKRGDRVLINYYQFGIFETLPNEWEFLRVKEGFYAEITRGDGCGDNFKKLPLWRIQKCSNTANSLEESAVSPMPQENGLAIALSQPDTAISIVARSQSTQAISPMSPSTETSELLPQPEENLTSLPADSLARVPATQEREPDSITQKADCGEKVCESCAKSVPDTPFGNNPWELSSEDLENCLEESEWLDILSSLQKSKQEASGRHTSAAEYLSLPTMTANAGVNSRPSGANKLEKKFEKLGLLPNGLKLSVPAMSLLMGYPSNWCEAIAPLQPSIQPASPEVKEEIKAESYLEKQSRPHKQELLLQESVTSQPQPQTNILPTSVTIEERYEIELLSGEKVERGIGGLFNHLAEGAPKTKIEVGAIAYIEKKDRGEKFEGKITRIFEKEYQDKCAVGDWVIIGDRHVAAGQIHQVTELRGGYIGTETSSFHPDCYSPLIGSLIKVSDRHPVQRLSGSVVKAVEVKNGYIKIENDGYIAFENCKGLAVEETEKPCNILPTPAIAAKAISLWQPWASLVGMKKKLYETRSWNTDYRGKILICSAKRATGEQLNKWLELSAKYGFAEEFKELPFGYAIAVCDLADCILMDEEFIAQQSPLEIDSGDWQPNRYAWKLENIEAIAPQPIRGYQGLWNIDIAPYIPKQKKRGRKPGSGNKKAASGYLYPRKDSQSYLYEYWDIEKKKKRCLSVRSHLGARVKNAIADNLSVAEIIKIIKGSNQLKLF